MLREPVMLGPNPNITGNNGSAGYANKNPGAFFNVYPRQGTAYASSNNINSENLGFNAGRSNAIYGESDVVQPAALQTLIIIKV